MSEITESSRHTPVSEASEREGVPTLIRESHRLLARVFQDHLNDPSIQVTDWFVLRALRKQDGLTQREVAQRIGILEAHTGVVVRRLVELGYVKRMSDPQDLRKQCVFLTQEGRQVEKSLRAVALEVDSIALAGLSPSQIETLRALLFTVRANLAEAARDS